MDARPAAPSPGPRSWPARYTVVALCSAAAFICYLDRVNISVAVLAMQQQFGWSSTVKGLVLSSFFTGYLFLQVGAGWLAGRCGGRLVLGLAVLWWSAFTLLTPLAASASLGALLAARIALGAGEAATFPAAFTLFSRWVPAAERSRAVAVMLSGAPLGTVAALLATGWIIERFGWPAAFYLAGSLGFLWAIPWFRAIVDDPLRHPRLTIAERDLLTAEQPAAAAPGPVPWRRLFAQPAVWALLVNHFCSNWTTYVLVAWLPSYFRESQGLSITGAGLYSVAPWLAMFVMMNVAAAAADRLLLHGWPATAVRKLMQSVGLLGAAAFLLLARDAASAPGAMWLMCGTMGFLACTYSGFGTNALEIAPRHAGVLAGASNTAGTIPGIIAVATTGWLVDLTGSYDAAFSLAAGVSVFGAVIWLLFATARPVVN